MEYTDKQYEMLGRLSGGLNWAMLPDEEMECVRYLIDQGLAQYRDDIAFDHAFLTEEGKRVLHLHNVHIRQKQQEQDDRDRLREEEATAKRAERDSDRRFQERLATKQTVLAALLGALVSNLDRIIGLIVRLVSG